MKKSTHQALRFIQTSLENWRNFTQVAVDLQRRVFLVGPNASGKSNFLDVFRFFHDLVAVGGGFQEAVHRRGGVSTLRCLIARRTAEIGLRVRLGSDEHSSVWEYELRFSQNSRQRPVITKERVLREEAEILIRPDRQDKEDPERLTQTYLEQVYANQAFREVAEFFSSIRYVHILPQVIREPDRWVGKHPDPFGKDFIEQIARTPAKTRKTRLQRIVNAMRVAVPQLKDLELEQDVRGTPHLRGIYEHWRSSGEWQTEEQFSDGTLRLIGLLWAMLEGTGPLLLEEPELSLHPEVVRLIPQVFARMQRRSGRQVLVSTHSTDLLRDDGIGLDEVLLLLPTDEGTTVRPANAFAEIKALLEGGLNLAEAVIPRTRPEKVQQLALLGD